MVVRRGGHIDVRDFLRHETRRRMVHQVMKWTVDWRRQSHYTWAQLKVYTLPNYRAAGTDPSALKAIVHCTDFIPPPSATVFQSLSIFGFIFHFHFRLQFYF